jgi:hypothetical protein
LFKYAALSTVSNISCIDVCEQAVHASVCSIYAGDCGMGSLAPMCPPHAIS